MPTEPTETSADAINIRSNTVTVYGQGGGGHNEPPQMRMAFAAFGGGLLGALLGALLCLLLRHCGCG